MISVAAPQDLTQLANLIHFDSYVHRHLDYRAPLEWVGHEPFFVYQENNRILAALACPPDPPHVAWIRLFASNYQTQVSHAWDLLWQAACAGLKENKYLEWVAAIPLQNWFANLLINSKFSLNHHIIMLRRAANSLPEAPASQNFRIRPMTTDDLDAVAEIDQCSFPPLWQISSMYLRIAFQQAEIATVAAIDDKIIGFQISTITSAGGHLARLAVDPSYQGNKIGSAIVRDLVTQFHRRGIYALTVNTQEDNHASLGLYKKIGFDFYGEKYPVYVLPVQEICQ